jgi:RNA polymerase-interacting CarD/CdnL/TRCF family regulator
MNEIKFNIGDKVYHPIYGFGTILGNRHKRHNGRYYWHVEYEDHTFGYASENKLCKADEID